MTNNTDFSIAVIADAHFHDIDGDYGVPGLGHRSLTLRTWDDTRTSTRVFNESAMALRAALNEVATRNIGHVVLLGDYTDDGQRLTTQSVAKLLADHEKRFGTRFYALPGNHDIFGPNGRHQAKRFLQADGTSKLVTSDAAEDTPDNLLNPHMYCEGYPLGLNPMAAFGYFRRADDLHWESPFGLSDDPASRIYAVSSPDGRNHYRLMDASYLIEPEKDLWLLMLDANVFEPRDGDFPVGSEQAFIDSTAAGWNAMLRLKPFIFEWIADVAKRAKEHGKTLLTFSHYPVIDPFDDPENTGKTLFPNSNMAKRKPSDAVAEALITAGITVHFSGHLHVEGVTRHANDDGQLINVAVPSLVAFPPAFKHLTLQRDMLAIDTIDLSALPVDPDIMAAYQHETTQTGAVPDAAIFAQTYGAFLRLHLTALVEHRFFIREWPRDVVACLAPMSVQQLCLDPRTRPARPDNLGLEDKQDLADLSVVEIVSDWYCLWHGGGRALPILGEKRLALLRWLADLYAEPADSDTSITEFLAAFFKALRHFLSRAEHDITQISLLPASLLHNSLNRNRFKEKIMQQI
ncbi:metallophosphoesterase family protein [Allorhizobium terrae]|uniref:Metallophosphoesterase n=1 Tax=Allorhizobium terrae TaxID=1848972 RepID=A0A4S3ZQC3_9HYPH|nr:metallophosphoesterase [Allorhizobium terrae]THF47739.1 metallophosphoesterase [Allorhizobium terrae]